MNCDLDWLNRFQVVVVVGVGGGGGGGGGGGAPCQMMKQMDFEFLSLTRTEGVIEPKNHDFLLKVTITATLN